MEEEHMIWKSCDRVQNGLEGLRGELGLGMTSRNYGSLWCTHGAHMYSGD